MTDARKKLLEDLHVTSSRMQAEINRLHEMDFPVTDFLPKAKYSDSKLAQSMLNERNNLEELLKKPGIEQARAIEAINAFKQLDITMRKMFEGVLHNVVIREAKVLEAFQAYEAKAVALKTFAPELAAGDSKEGNLNIVREGAPALRAEATKEAIDKHIAGIKTIEHEVFDKAMTDLKTHLNNQRESNLSRMYAIQLDRAFTKIWHEEFEIDPDEVAEEVEKAKTRASFTPVTPAKTEKQLQDQFERRFANLKKDVRHDRVFVREGSDIAVLEIHGEHGQRVYKPASVEARHARGSGWVWGQEALNLGANQKKPKHASFFLPWSTLLARVDTDARFKASYEELLDFAQVKEGTKVFNINYTSPDDVNLKELKIMLEIFKERARSRGISLGDPLDPHLFAFLHDPNRVKPEEKKFIYDEIAKIKLEAAKYADEEKRLGARTHIDEVERQVKVAAIDERIKELKDDFKAIPEEKKFGAEGRSDIEAVLGGKVDDSQALKVRIDAELSVLENRVQRIERAYNESVYHDYKTAYEAKAKYTGNEIKADEHLAAKIDALVEETIQNKADVAKRCDLILEAVKEPAELSLPFSERVEKLKGRIDALRIQEVKETHQQQAAAVVQRVQQEQKEQNEPSSRPTQP